MKVINVDLYDDSVDEIVTELKTSTGSVDINNTKIKGDIHGK
jgi:hypothetical protein